MEKYAKEIWGKMSVKQLAYEYHEGYEQAIKDGLFTMAEVSRAEIKEELESRGYDTEGRKIPYRPAPGEDPNSLWSKAKKAWYVFKQWYNYQ